MKTYKDTNVLVYVKSGTEKDDINGDVLKYVFKNSPELITENKWTDGYFILALNIESGDAAFGHGQVGTYFGEDLKVGPNMFQSFQEKGYDDFHLAKWTDGLVKISDAAAGRMGKPLLAEAWVYTSVISLFYIAGLIFFLKASQNRKNITSLQERVLEVDEIIKEYAMAAKNDFRGSYFEKIQKDAAKLVDEWKDTKERAEELSSYSLIRSVFVGNETSSLNRKVDKAYNSTLVMKNAVIIYHHMDGYEKVWNSNVSETRKALNSLIFRSSSIKLDDKDLKKAKELSCSLEKVSNLYLENDRKSDVNELCEKVNNINIQLSYITRKSAEILLEDLSPQKRKYVRSAIQSRASDVRNNSDNLFFYYTMFSLYTPAIHESGYADGVRNYDYSLSSSYRSNDNYSSDYSSVSTSYSGGGDFSGAGGSTSF